MDTDRGTKSIVRALDVLYILADNPAGISLSEISKKIEMPKSTLHRILTALSEKHLARKDETLDIYHLGYGILHFSNALLTNIDLVRDARPILEHLNQSTNETVHLGVLDFDEARVVYVDKFESTNVVRLVSRIGQSIPLHCTALGKAYLSALDSETATELISRNPLNRRTPNTITNPMDLLHQLEIIRSNGFAIDECENEPNVICIGAPVKNRNGKPLAAISISAPAERMVKENISKLGKEIISAALELSMIVSMLDTDYRI